MNTPDELKDLVFDINKILDEEHYQCSVAIEEANGLYRPFLEDNRQRFITYLYFPWGSTEDIRPALQGFYWGAMLPKMRGRKHT